MFGHTAAEAAGESAVAGESGDRRAGGGGSGMIFNVASLLKESSGGARRVTVSDAVLESDRYGPFEGVGGRLTMMRTDRTVLVTGTLAWKRVVTT